MGGLVVIRGEAGIGKSRLAEAAGEAAIDSGFALVWGRAIETGSAPAFWPFSEVLRGLLWRDPSFATKLSERLKTALSTLVPELASDAVPGVLHALPSQHARFVLLEAFASALSQAASAQPLLVVLEDMHAADLDSLQGLEILASQVRSAKIVLLVTTRPVSTSEAQVAQAFERIARVSSTVTLTPLSNDEIRAVAEATLGCPLDSAWIDALSRTSEGNPLFVIELCRLWSSKRAQGIAPLSGSLPATVRGTIRSRLDSLSEPARRLVHTAAVLGRQLELNVLFAVLSDLEDPDAHIEEVVDARIFEPVYEGRLRFTHVLLRDVAYACLTVSQRETLHRTIADHLGQAARSHIRWPELAHHLLASGHVALERGIEAARSASEQAFTRFAFDEASHWAERAIAAHTPLERAEPLRHGDLGLTQARALIAAGHLEEGRAICVRTFERARDLDLPELAGRAVLEYGHAFVVGVVDDTLIRLSEQALALLPASEKGLRARLSARRAAAMQPALDPGEPIALARAAVQEARELAQPNVLLETLRSATSTMADLEDPRVRRAYDEEMVALARSLEMPFDELKGLQRLTFDCFEVGDVATAHATLARLCALSERLAIPQARWIALGLSAMARTREGAFERAQVLLEQAREQGKQARDLTAGRALLLQRICQLRLIGHGEEALALLDHEFELLSEVSTTSAWHGALRTYLRGLTGSVSRMEEGVVADACRLGDPGVLIFCAEHALRARDREAASALMKPLRERVGLFASWGLLGLTVEAPFDRSLAHVQWALGALDEAVACMESALDLCEATGAGPHEALISAELSELLRERNRSQDRERSEALAASSERLLAELGMKATPGFSRAAASHGPKPQTEKLPTSPLETLPMVPAFARHGERWDVNWQSERLSLEDTKGLEFLARLVGSPGRRFHVFELLQVRRDEVDGGDAGELLDDTAIDSYRQRVHTLREQAGEHEAQGAEQAAQRVRAEIEAIEDELSRALGLGGRKRRQGSAVEKARINVQRRIRDALRRIARTSPALARYLDKSIKTGTTCVFDP
jgi:hypothetical protein